jgi:hypothetical protein
MESVYHIVAIRVNETSWAHVWRLHSCYLGTGYDTKIPSTIFVSSDKLLGYMVSARRINANLKKVEVIKQFQPPRTQREI